MKITLEQEMAKRKALNELGNALYMTTSNPLIEPKETPTTSYTIVKDVHMMKVADISTKQTEYNRPINNANLKKIKVSMELDGFHRSQVVELNHNLEVIDGQHRVRVAAMLGVLEIPVIIYRFKTTEDEADFCKRRNNTQKKQTAKEKLLCDRAAGYALAVSLYKLNTDDKSLAYRRIDLEKAAEDTWKQDTHYKLSASVLMHVVNIVANNKNTAYKDADSEKLEGAISKMSYIELRKGVNLILGSFYDTFGSRTENKAAYVDKFFRSYLSFSKQLLDNNLLEDKYDDIVHKMRSFMFKEFLKELNQDEIVKRLRAHYNAGKIYNRI